MSGISSSVGLISGLPTADLIDQLMEVEARPVTLAQNRLDELDSQKASWMGISASLLGLKLAAENFDDEDTFVATKGSSSNTSVLNATADAGAALGTYQFTVRRLVQNHQLISAGYADSDSTPVGAGILTFDMGRGRIDGATELDFLNGQNGVQRGTIRITDWAGTTSDVDLTNAVTVADVLDAINNDTELGIQARAVGDGIVLTDTTGEATGTITVTDIGSGRAAADLGIAGSATNTALVGTDINYITTSTSLDLLRDGTGIERTEAGDDISFTLGDGTTFSVNLYGEVVEGSELVDKTAYDIGDVIDAINNHGDNGGKLVASLGDDNKSIKLTDTTRGGGDLVVADASGSSAATQLGLAGTYTGSAVADVVVDGDALIAGLNSVMVGNLNGGTGVTPGMLDLQDRDGNATTIDLSDVTSVSDIIEAINNNGSVSLTAAINTAGNGITITDTTGSTAFHMVVADNGGDIASVLGIAVDDDVTEVVGTNANHKYISTQTRLDHLNPAEDFTGGSFTITNSLGTSVTVNVSSSNVTRVEDVIRNINSVAEDSLQVTARLNDEGTGIILEDAAGGAELLKVEEVGSGRAAHQLGILGEAETGETFIDGSFRTGISIEATDTLQDVVDKINAADMGIAASVINDQSRTNPYRLVLSSEVSGVAGEIVYDAGETGMTMTTFVEARDALVYLGTPGTSNAVVVTSSSNQLTDLISGVTLDLTGTDDDPVSITISRDVDTIVSRMESFTDAYNSIIDNLKEATKFNSETLEKGVLFGDASVSLIQSRLANLILGTADVTGTYTRLGDVGFSLVSGGELSFDAEEFRAAYATDPTSVQALFAQAAETTEVTDNGITLDEPVAGTGGVGALFELALEDLTDDLDGFITSITDGLDSKSNILNDRIDYLNILLDKKRERLERQFAAMETALAQIQSQGNALNSLASLASSFSSSGQ